MEKQRFDGLRDNEVGFVADNGLRVAVRSSKKEMSGGSVALKVMPRVVDENGETVREPPTGGVRTVHIDGLTDGSVDLKQELADHTRKVVEATIQHDQAMQAYDDLPIPEDD